MRKAIPIAITLIILIGTTFVAMEESLEYGDNGGAPHIKDSVIELIQHNPIKITNNLELSKIASTGSGTKKDPYIIENYDINGTGHEYCIHIEKTTKYFIIQNCYLHDVKSNWRTPSSGSGLILLNVENGTVENVTSSYNEGCGFYLDGSSNIFFKNNTVVGNGLNGFYMWHSPYNLFINNIIINNKWYGIYNDIYSPHNFFRNNTMIHDGIFLQGYSLKDWNTQYIDSTNTVNGKPIYYWKNITGGKVPEGAGEIIVANCKDVLIENQNLSGGDVGIIIGQSTHTIVRNTTAEENDVYGFLVDESQSSVFYNNTAKNNGEYGFCLRKSRNNTFYNNMAFDNAQYGFNIFYSGYGIFRNNVAMNNGWFGFYIGPYSSSYSFINNTASYNGGNGFYISESFYITFENNCAKYNEGRGFYLSLSSNNLFFRNTFAYNEWQGIYSGAYSENNSIYQNNFICNKKRAYDYLKENHWNASYPIGGNYWSDYEGFDNCSGPNQNEEGSDGVGDDAYLISSEEGETWDYYPLISPVNISSISCRDLLAPTIVICFPIHRAINTTDITVKWKISNIEFGMHHYEVKIDNKKWIDVGKKTSYNFSGLYEGNHLIEIKAIDLAWNEATNSISFRVDTRKPTVTISSPSEGSILKTSTVTVSWAGSDIGSGIDRYEVRIDGGLWLNVSRTSTACTFTNLSNGNHMLEVRGVDNAGNERTSQVWFEVNTESGGDDGGLGESNTSSGNLLWIFILLIVLVLAGIMAAAFRKRKSAKDEEETETEEEDEDIEL